MASRVLFLLILPAPCNCTARTNRGDRGGPRRPGVGERGIRAGTKNGHNDTGARSAPPPLLHPESATARLGLTPEETREVHEECLRVQREIQEEMDKEDRIARERETKRDVHDAHPPLEHHADSTRKLFKLNRGCTMPNSVTFQCREFSHL
jgi:hypothetical protein